NAMNVLFADTVTKASADAICIKQGGTVRMLKVSGDLITHGNEVHTICDEAGIERLLVSGKVVATGEKSVALDVENGYLGADNVEFVSEKWAAIKVENAKINNCHQLIAKGKDFDILIDILSSVDKNIFAKEFLTGIFQPDVRLEYTDNVNSAKKSPAATPTAETSAFNVTDITPDNPTKEGHPMSCKAPTNIKPEDKNE
ncbi:MAG: hypothetical protein ACRCSQ_00195, partial [Bacteroidales bacterium]